MNASSRERTDVKVITGIKRDDMTDEPHFSNSQLQMYLRCSEQYRFRYVMGLKIPPTLNMNAGKAVHDVLETNAIYKMSKGEDMPVEAVLDLMSTTHDQAMEEVEGSAKEKGKDKDDSVAMTGHYRRKYAPKIEPVAAELGFKLIIPADEEKEDYLPVIGYIDSVSKLPDPRQGPTQGQLVNAMEDYKKVDRRKSQLEIDVNTQLTLYDYVYTLSVGTLPDVIGLRLLGNDGPRAKTPGPYAELMTRSQPFMDRDARARRHMRVIDQIKRVQRAIEQEVFIPTDDYRTCSWCGYRDICQVRPDR